MLVQDTVLCTKALFGLVRSTPSTKFDQQLGVLNEDSLQN